MGQLSTRTLRSDEYGAFFDVFAAAFLDDALDTARDAYRGAFDPELTHGVFDGDELIGVAGRLELEITVPGPVPCRSPRSPRSASSPGTAGAAC